MTIEQAHQGGIDNAHEIFERLTGKKYGLHRGKMFAWEKFLVRCKFTVEDIEIVVKHLHGEIAAKRAFPPQLWFNKLIEDTDRFEEYLGEAKAKLRNAAPIRTDKDRVLEASGRPIVRRSEINAISMNERVNWHLTEMRKAVGFKEKDDARRAAISKLFDGQKPYTQEHDRIPGPCGDCDPCIGGRPDQCAIFPRKKQQEK